MNLRCKYFSSDCYHSLADTVLCRYLFRFTGEEEEINLAGDGSEKPEFEKWTWMTPEELLDHVGTANPVYGPVKSVKMKGDSINLILTIFLVLFDRLLVSRSRSMRKF